MRLEVQKYENNGKSKNNWKITINIQIQAIYRNQTRLCLQKLSLARTFGRIKF